MDVILETERLRLRAPLLSDAEPLFRHYAQYPEVAKYLSWKTHVSVEDTHSWLSEKVAQSMERGNLHFAIIPKELQEPVGMLFCGMHGVRAHLGYALGPAYWGKGYVSEAVQQLMSYLFDRGDIWRVEAICDIHNLGSARVMEKSGMKREALLKHYNSTPNHTPGPKDVYLYARVKEK